MTTERKSEDYVNRLVNGVAVVFAIGVHIGIAACALSRCAGHGSDDVLVPMRECDTIHEVVWDTIPYYYPVPKDSAVARYITEKLPVASGEENNLPAKNETKLSERDKKLRDSVQNFGKSVPDSANVVIPIMQKHYEDSTYSAWVSGYKAVLDSIYVYPRREVQTITIHTAEQKRWNFGVSGGIGVVYDGGWHCGPGLNIGVTYSF